MTLKVGMDHLDRKVYTIYKNDDAGFTLTHFTANCVKMAYCAYKRPRRQVSVYMTIGPLVFFVIIIFPICSRDHLTVISKRIRLTKTTGLIYKYIEDPWLKKQTVGKHKYTEFVETWNPQETRNE